MTSCGGRTLQQTSKLRYRPLLLRVRTIAHPYAKVDLNLKKKKGMSRKYCYVSMKRYKIELRTLGLYERQLGEYCLTKQSLGKLVGRIKGGH